jgi:hypothetical protein
MANTPMTAVSAFFQTRVQEGRQITVERNHLNDNGQVQAAFDRKINEAKSGIAQQIRSSTDGAFTIQISGKEASPDMGRTPQISGPLRDYVRMQNT